MSGITTIPIKLVTIGDGNVGKTCALMTFSSNAFPGDVSPTIFDNYTANVARNGKMINLNLWDTAGQSEYDRLRPLSYPETDIFLVCFSVSSRSSLNNVTQKWIPEISHHCPGAPVLLVGTKLDLRGEREPAKLVSEQEGKDLAAKVKALKYMECSALTQEGLRAVFDAAIDLVLSPKKPKPKKTCALL